MISKWNFSKNCKDCYCQTPELIENYEQAINDQTQVWECHHRDEIRILPSGMVAIRTREELIENGRYYNCPPNELIFLTRYEHNELHGKFKSNEICKRCSKAQENISKSDFGRKFREHFKVSCREDRKLYFRERLWYLNHNKTCRWEKEA